MRLIRDEEKGVWRWGGGGGGGGGGRGSRTDINTIQLYCLCVEKFTFWQYILK